MVDIPVRAKVNPLQEFMCIVRSELRRLDRDLILSESGGYRAFQDYFLCAVSGGWRVTKRRDVVAEFTSSRTALAWCIADKYQQWDLARRIQQLDQRLFITDRGLDLRQRRAQQHSSSLLLAKIQHRQQQRFTTKSELDKCVSRAKYLQIRGFRNDTQRN
jgi:hypothetical protein